MRIYLETIENVVGSNGLKSILNYAHLEKYIEFPPDNDDVVIPLEDIKLLCRALLELFGQKGARTLQLKIACVLVPETKKMRIVLEKLVETSRERYTSTVYTPDERVELREEEDFFFIIERDGWESEDIVAQMSVCDVYRGTIEAAIEWVTGNVHEVKEIECRAMGHPADVFRIAKARKE